MFYCIIRKTHTNKEYTMVSQNTFSIPTTFFEKSRLRTNLYNQRIKYFVCNVKREDKITARLFLSVEGMQRMYQYIGKPKIRNVRQNLTTVYKMVYRIIT